MDDGLGDLSAGSLKAGREASNGKPATLRAIHGRVESRRTYPLRIASFGGDEWPADNWTVVSRFFFWNGRYLEGSYFVATWENPGSDRVRLGRRSSISLELH
jgi:hypothetical protein